MGSQTILRLFISLRETFSNLAAFTVVKKYGQGALVQISTVFHQVYDAICQTLLWNGAF